MFYCMHVFPQDSYYLEAEGVIVIYQQQKDQLHLYDIISQTEVELKGIVNKIAAQDTRRVIFHFTPDFSPPSESAKLTKQVFKGSEVLFIRTHSELSLPFAFKHPLTSQA